MVVERKKTPQREIVKYLIEEVKDRNEAIYRFDSFDLGKIKAWIDFMLVENEISKVLRSLTLNFWQEMGFVEVLSPWL